MCRNIKPLYNFAPPATDQEIREAALQFVRKISGFPKPSARNEVPFNSAVDAISSVMVRLMAELETNAPPKDRDVEAERARAKSRDRFNRDQPSL